MSDVEKTDALDKHQATRFLEFSKQLEEEIGKVIVGQNQTVREVLIALLPMQLLASDRFERTSSCSESSINYTLLLYWLTISSLEFDIDL